MSVNSASVKSVEPIARATWKDYIVLTKPRVISLLLFTTLAAMFIAKDATHPVTALMFLGVAIGGYMSAGAANAFNMVYDSDIDGRMERTTSRPTVTHVISAHDALIFGFALEICSFVILTAVSNVLAASLALAGLLFYVFIYTMLLKRRTWQNIVIGGAAGAFPPLVGWAAVAGHLNGFAWLLFAIIFVWTPVHFWALAILIKDDYEKAGVPMLPVVKGDKATVVQIVGYAYVTVLCTIAPYFIGKAHWLYLVGAVLLNMQLIKMCYQLKATIARKQASGLFHYSMIYLAALFLLLAVDHLIL